MTPISCQAILFDLDGTLVDSWKCVEYAWQTWCLEHTLDYNDLVHKFNGMRAVDIVRLLKPTLDSELEMTKLNLLESAHPENITAIPGALDIIKLLPPNKWGIVTSGTYQVSTHKLKCAQIAAPGAFITADKITHGKPNPQGYLMAAQLLGLQPQQCLVFEDAPQGIKAARAAGMKVIALTTTFPTDALFEAETCIDNYKCLNISIDDSQITVRLITP